MKKFIKPFIATAVVALLIAFMPFEEIKSKIDEYTHTDPKKIQDSKELLDEILEHIAMLDPQLTFANDQLLDSELAIARYNILPLSVIDHFDEQLVVNGFVVRPVVTVEDPKTIIILEAVDIDASVELMDAFKKVQSDQWADFKNHGIFKRYLVDHNKSVRQGVFLLYVTWEDNEDIVKIFERHVR